MSSTKSKAAILLAVFGAGYWIVGAGAIGRAEGPDETKFARWVMPVAFHEASGEEVENLANELRTALDIQIGTLKSRMNPGCCIWLEVKPWLVVAPEAQGYVIIIRHGGATVTATNVEQLKLAVRRLRDVCKDEGDKVFLPLGLMTNYPIAETEKQGK